MEADFKHFTTQRVSQQHINDSGIVNYPKEWSRETILRLIELFKEKRVLWDTNDIDFKNRNKKHSAWLDLGAEMDVDAMEVEKKMRMLIGQFRRELKRGKCGDSADSAFKSKWAFFPFLMFLKVKNETGYASPRNSSPFSHPNDDIMGETSNSITENENRSLANVQMRSKESGQVRRHYNRIISRRSRMDGFKRKTDVTSTSMSGERMKKDSVKQRDEFDVFGEHIANTLRNLNSRLIQSHTKFEISNVLYRAEIDDHKQEVYSSVDPAILSGMATSYSFASTPNPSNLSTSTDNNDRNDEFTTV